MEQKLLRWNKNEKNDGTMLSFFAAGTKVIKNG